MLCYICLLKPERWKIDEDTRHLEWIANPAVTYIAGTAVCKKHLKSVANSDVLAVEPTGEDL